MILNSTGKGEGTDEGWLDEEVFAARGLFIRADTCEVFVEPGTVIAEENVIV